MESQDHDDGKKKKIPKRPKDKIEGTIWDLQHSEDLETRAGAARLLLGWQDDNNLKTKDQQKVMGAIGELNPQGWLDLYKSSQDLRLVGDVARDLGGSEEGKKTKITFGQLLQAPNLDPMALQVAQTLSTYMPESQQFDQEVNTGQHPDHTVPKPIGTRGETIVRPNQKNEVHDVNGQIVIRPSPGHDPRSMTIIAGSMEDFLMGRNDRKVGIGMAQSLHGGSQLVKEVNTYMYEKMMGFQPERAMQVYQDGDRELTDSLLQSQITEERRQQRLQQQTTPQVQTTPPQPSPPQPSTQQQGGWVRTQPSQPTTPPPQQGGWKRAEPKKDRDLGD